MGFPIPGDAIEQSLDLNQWVIKNSAATFFIKIAAVGLKPTWTMRADYFSKRYTTHWSELLTVKGYSQWSDQPMSNQ